MVGTFLASTPLLQETWRLCGTANLMGCGALVAELVGGVGYVAFSGVQVLPLPSSDLNYGTLVPLGEAGRGLFTPLKRHYDGEELVMVHSGLLSLFLDFHSGPDFQSQVRPRLKYLVFVKAWDGPKWAGQAQEKRCFAQASDDFVLPIHVDQAWADLPAPVWSIMTYGSAFRNNVDR
ncbi:hypothetical protein NL676_019501 [Syzygium grande]|nr:hypothetical protein NL676_019501 [Syzygium grande]